MTNNNQETHGMSAADYNEYIKKTNLKELFNSELADKSHRADIQRKLQEMLSSSNVHLFDTETTGLDESARIVEFSMINQNGKIILDTLVNPQIKIPNEVSDIHGIYDKDVSNAPIFDNIAEMIYSIIYNNNNFIFAYNIDYDLRLIQQSTSNTELPMLRQNNHICLMDLFSKYIGIRKEERFSRHKLIAAAEYFGYPTCGAHRALHDSQMALAVLNGMANTPIN